jgi:uncharacterized Fe-S cluster protein YjdI
MEKSREPEAGGAITPGVAARTGGGVVVIPVLRFERENRCRCNSGVTVEPGRCYKGQDTSQHLSGMICDPYCRIVRSKLSGIHRKPAIIPDAGENPGRNGPADKKIIFSKPPST